MHCNNKVCHAVADVELFTYYIIICDFKNLVTFDHKHSWQPPPANSGSCDFNDVVAFGHNQLYTILELKNELIKTFLGCSPFQQYNVL